MRYGIFGDVHANLPALDAVLAALADEALDAYLCLGDLVGYGADPGPCVRKVRELAPVIVGGNHDYGAAGRLSLAYFNRPARDAIEWTRAALSPDEIAWLGGLPLVRRLDRVTLAHSTLHDPPVFDYLFSPYDAFLSFRRLTTPVAFVGHSHVPITFFDGNPVTYRTDEVIPLDAQRAIANVGSVGQPRDEDPRAAFGVYDEEAGSLEVRRVRYDVEEAAARIAAAGLPEILGDRLRVGR